MCVLADMDGSDRRKTNDRGIWPCSAFWDRVYPCGFRKELRETLKIGWSLVSESIINPDHEFVVFNLLY